MTSTSVAMSSVQLTVRGEVPRRIGAHLHRRIEGVLRASPARPILHSHVVVELAPDRSQARPARVEVSADVNGTAVRVHVAAADLHSAGALAADRLEQRLIHLRARNLVRHRWLGIAAEHSWRHGAMRAQVGHPPLSLEDSEPLRSRTRARHRSPRTRPRTTWTSSTTTSCSSPTSRPGRTRSCTGASTAGSACTGCWGRGSARRP